MGPQVHAVHSAGPAGPVKSSSEGEPSAHGASGGCVSAGKSSLKTNSHPEGASSQVKPEVQSASAQSTSPSLSLSTPSRQFSTPVCPPPCPPVPEACPPVPAACPPCPPVPVEAELVGVPEPDPVSPWKTPPVSAPQAGKASPKSANVAKEREKPRRVDMRFSLLTGSRVEPRASEITRKAEVEKARRSELPRAHCARRRLPLASRPESAPSAFMATLMALSAVPELEAVELVPPRSTHAQAWFAWRSEPLAQRYMPIEPWSVEALRKRLALSVPDLSDPEKQEHRWIVQWRGESVGIVSILRPSFRLGIAEVSYHIAQAYHRKGIATLAVTALVDRVFNETELARLYAYISEGNRASRRLAEKLGFVHEGTLREHFAIAGRRVDQCVYGLLRRDWPPSRRAPRRA